jgi:adenylate cyclase
MGQPTLESYSLLLGGIKLMHRSRRVSPDAQDPRRTNQPACAYRGPASVARYILRVTRGWSEDRKREAAEALSATHAALDRDPSDALALATEGFVS